MRLSSAFMRWPRTRASRRRSPAPGSCQRDTSAARSGRCSRNHSQARLEVGHLGEHARARWSRRRTAASGRPASAPCSALAVAVGVVQDVVEELVLARPTARCRRRPCCSSRRRCRGSARRTWWRCPRRPGCAAASSRAMAIRFRRTRPSSWCRRSARGSRRSAAARCGRSTPMLSRPRKPPWKTLLPSASLRFTHQVKLSISLWKTRSRKSRSPVPRALAASIL